MLNHRYGNGTGVHGIGTAQLSAAQRQTAYHVILISVLYTTLYYKVHTIYILYSEIIYYIV